MHVKLLFTCKEVSRHVKTTMRIWSVQVCFSLSHVHMLYTYINLRVFNVRGLYKDLENIRVEFVFLLEGTNININLNHNTIDIK